MQNIQWARENDYPADKIQKLNEREEKCKELKAQQVKDPLDEVHKFFELSYPPNPKVPFIADCLFFDPPNGRDSHRGIFTSRDLKPGDIVSCEKSVFGNGHEEMSHIRCCNCYKMKMSNLIPCTKTATLMFCSENCRDEVYAKVKNLDSMVTSNDKHHDINLERLLRECEEAFGGRQGLINFLKQTDWKNLKCTIFDFDFSNPNDPEYKQNLIKCVLALEFGGMDEEMRLESRYDDFEAKAKELSENDSSIEYFLLKLGLIGENSSTSSNFHVIEVHTEYSSGNTGTTTPNLAPNWKSQSKEPHLISVEVFIRYINNNCKPNTFEIPSEDGCMICVSRPIKAGEELFRSYQ